MKRNVELLRAILKSITHKPNRVPAYIDVVGFDEETVGQHVVMLFEAGYVEGTLQQVVPRGYKTVLVVDLTWEGHELAGALLASETVWQDVKKSIGEPRLETMPLIMIESMATQALTTWAFNRLGL